MGNAMSAVEVSRIDEAAEQSPHMHDQASEGTETRRRRCDAAFWVRKLFTKEDPNYYHKWLGLACVLSFGYRYYCLVVKASLGLGNDWFSWFTIATHLLLSTSSLIFHVLKKRIINRPMVIWEEYRLHAIVFTLRSCSVFAYGALRPSALAGSVWEPAALYGLVMMHHMAADAVTARYGSRSYTTVRIQDKSTLLATAALRFYSYYQFAAIAAHLTPSDQLADMGFNTLVAIQSSAFLMTLYRKGLVAYYTHAIVYSACLVLSLYAMALVLPLSFWVATLVPFAVRVRFRWSKYGIWAAFTAATTIRLVAGV